MKEIKQRIPLRMYPSVLGEVDELAKKKNVKRQFIIDEAIEIYLSKERSKK